MVTALSPLLAAPSPTDGALVSTAEAAVLITIEVPPEEATVEVPVSQRFPARTTALGKVIGDYLTKAKELGERTTHLISSVYRNVELKRVIIDQLMVVMRFIGG